MTGAELESRLAGATCYGINDDLAEADDLGESLELLDALVGDGERAELVGYVVNDEELECFARGIGLALAELAADWWDQDYPSPHEVARSAESRIASAFAAALVEHAPSKPLREVGRVSISRAELDALFAEEEAERRRRSDEERRRAELVEAARLVTGARFEENSARCWLPAAVPARIPYRNATIRWARAAAAILRWSTESSE